MRNGRMGGGGQVSGQRRSRGKGGFFFECRRKAFGRMVTKLEAALGSLMGASVLQPFSELESKSAKKRLELGKKALRLVAGEDDYRPMLRSLK